MLGLPNDPPVEHIGWRLEVDAAASGERIEELKRIADERCPAVWCVRNAVPLTTEAVVATTVSE